MIGNQMIALRKRLGNRPLRIVVTGAECTGKTTLVQGLSDQFSFPVVGEAARTWAARVGRPLTRFDVERIALLHSSEVRRAEEGSGTAVLLDTDLVSTGVYARHYFGIAPRWLSSGAFARRGALYLLCGADIPWQEDPGQRGAEQDRREVQRRLVRELTGLDAPVIRIEGNPEMRLKRAGAAVRELLGSR